MVFTKIIVVFVISMSEQRYPYTSLSNHIATRAVIKCTKVMRLRKKLKSRPLTIVRETTESFVPDAGKGRIFDDGMEYNITYRCLLV